jgi:hypothetical protein
LPDTDRGALLAAVTANAGRHGAAAVAFFTADAGPSVHCRGYADHQTRVPATARTRFELGSVTKTFTALLLGVLVAFIGFSLETVSGVAALTSHGCTLRNSFIQDAYMLLRHCAGIT